MLTNEILNFILFFMSSLGITVIVVLSKIFLPIREQVEKIKLFKINELINCTLCFGFWVGFGVSIYFYKFNIILNILLACASSVFTWLVSTYIEKIYYEKMKIEESFNN
jgi:hypothetical protein